VPENYKMVKTVKLYKTTIKFLRWFVVMMLILGLVSCISGQVCPTAHTSVIAHLKDSSPKINNITTNQHKNFKKVLYILTVFTIL
jgi:hypothetical protein